MEKTRESKVNIKRIGISSRLVGKTIENVDIKRIRISSRLLGKTRKSKVDIEGIRVSLPHENNYETPYRRIDLDNRAILSTC